MKAIPTVVSVMTPFPPSIEAAESLGAARTIMQQHAIAHLPVTEGGHVVGVLSNHHLQVGAGEHAQRAGGTRVGDVCCSDPYVVNVSSQVDEVVLEMATRAASCAVVLRNDKLAGILTASDVCRLFGELLRETFPPEEDDEPA